MTKVSAHDLRAEPNLLADAHSGAGDERPSEQQAEGAAPARYLTGTAFALTCAMAVILAELGLRDAERIADRLRAKAKLFREKITPPDAGEDAAFAVEELIDAIAVEVERKRQAELAAWAAAQRGGETTH